jgi:hypothetical protein
VVVSPPEVLLVGIEQEVWNQGTESTDCVFHNAFGNTHIAIDDLVVEGDKIAVRLIMSKAGRNKSLVTLPFEN